MPLTVKDLFERAQIVLNDLGAKRWPLTELLQWLNDGAARVCVAKPNACTTPSDLQLDAGSEQSLPVTATGLVRPLWSQDAAGGRIAVTTVSREKLDVFDPAWHLRTGVTKIEHIIYDPADPETFHVYPPSTGDDGSVLHAILTVPPAVIDAPSVPLDIASYSMALPIGDEFIGALLDYLLYRAFSKDATHPNAMARSAGHFQQFQIAIGEKVQRDIVMAPATAHTTPKT